MLFKTLVMCQFLFISVSSKNEKEYCSDYRKNIVTINKNQKPYWFQNEFGVCIDGSSFSEIATRSLHFEKNSVIKEISNFDKIIDLYLDNLNLENIPFIINLASIKKISLSKNKLTHIQNNFLEGSPVELLIFSINQIESIEDNSIPESVNELLLTCNNITTLLPSWFKNPASLRKLSLGGNKISALPENMFKDFINLKRLELRNNEIKTLGPGSISGPIKMDYLHLGYNKLYEIKSDVFGPSVSINFMNIEYNRLSFLHESLLNKLKVGQLKVWGNPWQCPCKDLIQKWLEENSKDFSVGVVRDEDPTCIIAETFAKHCVPFVDEKLYSDFVMSFETYPIQFC